MHTLDSSPKAIRYFDDVARRDGGVEDYFSGRAERPGRWMGAGLEQVGLRQGVEVEPDAVHRVIFHGEHPITGDPLGQRMRSDGIAGFGMTFSAPKSVSLLWALASPEVARSIEAAEAAAVQAGLTYVERHASYARRGRNGIEQVDGGGFIASAYFHRASRECDPQLHTHVLVANRTLCDDGRWRTLDSRQIMWRTEMLKAAGAVYQLALRAELSRSLGVEWEPVTEHGQADIAGVPRSLIEEFSKRAAQVRAAAADMVAERAGIDPGHLGRQPSQWELQKAAYDTRRHKVGVDSERIHDLWKAEAAAAGWDAKMLEQVALRRTRRHSRTDLADPEFRRQVLSDLTLRDAAFRSGHAAFAVARHIEIASASKAVDAVDAKVAAVLASSEVIQLAGPERSSAGFPKRASDGRSTVTRADDRCYSVDAVLAQEIRVLERAEAGRTARVAVVPADVLAGAMAIHDRSFPHRPLSDDQRQAVRTFTADGQRVSIVIGPAGTGKSVTLGVARAAWEAAGYRVRGYAPFGAAAASLQQSAGVESDVVAKLLYEQRRLEQLPPDQRDRWALTSRDVVVVDEAATLGTADLDQLMTAVEAAGAKLVLAGDHRQLSPVVRGGLFPELHRRLGGAELTEAHRFDLAWEREAAMGIRRQDVRALDDYDAHGRIRSGDRQAMIEAVYEHWAGAYLGGCDALMIAHTNELVDELNQRAQQLLRELGRVDPGGVAIASGAVANVGDIVVTRHPDRRIRVSGPSGYVRNGSRWRVLDVGPAGLVVEELAPPGTRPGRADIPARYATEHVRLGYAATGHSSQGRTVDSVGIVLQGGEDANWLYSAVTRGREGTTLFVATEATQMAAEYGKEPPTARQVLEAVVLRNGEQQTAVAELEAGLARSERVPHLEVLATAEQSTDSLARERQSLKASLLRAPSDRDLRMASVAVERATKAFAAAGERLDVARGRLDEVESRPLWRRSGKDARSSKTFVGAATQGLASADRAVADAREKLAKIKGDVVRSEALRHRLELIDAALVVQVGRAVVRSPGYLVAALGPRPPDRTAARREWDRDATRLETYRHVELGVGPDDGALAPSGVRAAIGGRPSDAAGRMAWDHAVERPSVARGRALEREPLGIDL